MTILIIVGIIFSVNQINVRTLDLLEKKKMPGYSTKCQSVFLKAQDDVLECLDLLRKIIDDLINRCF